MTSGTLRPSSFLIVFHTPQWPFAARTSSQVLVISVFAWLRKGRETQERCLVVVNFTPEVYRDYRIKVPFSGVWREVLNTDAAIYGGTNIGNGGAVRTLDGREIPELSLTVPPLAAIFLIPER